MGKIFQSILIALSGGQLVDAEEKILNEIIEGERVEAEKLIYTKEAFEELSSQYDVNVQQLKSRIGELTRTVSSLEGTVKQLQTDSDMVTAPMYSLISAYVNESRGTSGSRFTDTYYTFRHNITQDDVTAKGDTEKAWYLKQKLVMWDPDKVIQNELKKARS